MPYDAEVNFLGLAADVEAKAKNLMHSSREARAAYRRWLKFRNGRTDADIATALSRTEAEVTDVRLAYKAFNESHDFLSDVAGPVQGDRFAIWRKFI